MRGLLMAFTLVFIVGMLCSAKLCWSAKCYQKDIQTCHTTQTQCSKTKCTVSMDQVYVCTSPTGQILNQSSWDTVKLLLGPGKVSYSGGEQIACIKQSPCEQGANCILSLGAFFCQADASGTDTFLDFHGTNFPAGADGCAE